MTFAIAQWSFFEAGKIVKRSLLEMMARVPGKLTTKLDTLGRPMQWHTIERLYANSLARIPVAPSRCARRRFSRRPRGGLSVADA